MIKRKYGLEYVIWRISRWLFMILFIISLHVAWCLPSRFCSRKYVGWKLFEKFHEGCLVHANRWYLRGMKEAFLSPFLVWRIQSIYFSWGHMVWMKILFEEYQDCCLVLGQPDIWIKWVYLFWASMLPGFCSREHMVFKKKLFKEFQDGCFFCMAIFEIWMDWFEQ